MTSVAIIGAGQAGTLAAVGLMNAGHSVTLYSDRTTGAGLSALGAVEHLDRYAG